MPDTWRPRQGSASPSEYSIPRVTTGAGRIRCLECGATRSEAFYRLAEAPLLLHSRESYPRVTRPLCPGQARIPRCHGQHACSAQTRRRLKVPWRTRHQSLAHSFPVAAHLFSLGLAVFVTGGFASPTKFAPSKARRQPHKASSTDTPWSLAAEDLAQLRSSGASTAPSRTLAQDGCLCRQRTTGPAHAPSLATQRTKSADIAFVISLPCQVSTLGPRACVRPTLGPGLLRGDKANMGFPPCSLQTWCMVQWQTQPETCTLSGRQACACAFPALNPSPSAPLITRYRLGVGKPVS